MKYCVLVTEDIQPRKLNLRENNQVFNYSKREIHRRLNQYQII